MDERLLVVVGTDQPVPRGHWPTVRLDGSCVLVDGHEGPKCGTVDKLRVVKCTDDVRRFFAAVSVADPAVAQRIEGGAEFSMEVTDAGDVVRVAIETDPALVGTGFVSRDWSAVGDPVAGDRLRHLRALE